MIVRVLLRLFAAGLKAELAIGLITPLEIVEVIDNVGITACAISISVKKFEDRNSDAENAYFVFLVSVFMSQLLTI